MMEGNVFASIMSQHAEFNKEILTNFLDAGLLRHNGNYQKVPNFMGFQTHSSSPDKLPSCHVGDITRNFLSYS